MTFIDPDTVQDPTTNVIALAAWGDAVNGDLNFLRGAKAGCRLSSVVGTAAGSFMPWGTEVYDVNGCHDLAVNTSRITVPSGWAGLWFVGCDIAMTSGVFDMSITVNGTSTCGQSSSASGSVDTGAACSMIYEMAVGDYFEVFVNNGTSRSTSITSYFYATWLASDA